MLAIVFCSFLKKYFFLIFPVTFIYSIIVLYFSFQEEDVAIDPPRINEAIKPHLHFRESFKNDGSQICAVTPELKLQGVNLLLEKEVTEISPL